MTAAPTVLSYALEPRAGRRLRVAAQLVSFYPFAPLVSLYLSGVATRLALGHWPRVCVDPSSAPGLDLLTRWLVIGSVPAAAANAALILLAMAWALRYRQRRDATLVAALPLLTWGVALALLWWDPAGLWKWLLD